LAAFRSKLRLRAETLDIQERQQILRLLVKEVQVSADTITIRHSIPVPASGSGSNGMPRLSDPSGGRPAPGYRLRTGSLDTAPPRNSRDVFIVVAFRLPTSDAVRIGNDKSAIATELQIIGAEAFFRGQIEGHTARRVGRQVTSEQRVLNTSPRLGV
jgi:hypothetical protein